ncbi:MAG: Rossmann-like and DUF2520 domain-containing protein [Bacteroidales bacterium]
MNISVIGSGNVATNLAIKLHLLGHNIIDVYSRSINNAKALAQRVDAKAHDNLEKLDQQSDLYIVAVSDSAVPSIASALRLGDAVLVHTAGSVSMKVLEGASSNIGVFYPLQTFTKDKKIEFANIPILVEANNEQTVRILSVLANSISNKLVELNSEQRLRIHIAAVFANNFTNHCLSIAQEILENESLEPSLILPLVAETFRKFTERKASDVQTGPARRNDISTMNKHMQVLASNKDFLEMYRLVSNSIVNKYREESH